MAELNNTIVNGSLRVIGDLYNSGLTTNLNNKLSLTGGTMTGTIIHNVAAGSDENILYGILSSNDFFRLRGSGGSDSNNGSIALETADDGNEPISVAQYTGVFANEIRRAYLLNSSGNTSFPGVVSGRSFSGAGTGLTGTASSLTSGASAKLTNTSAIGSATQPVYFSANGVPVAGTYVLGDACTKGVTDNSTSPTAVSSTDTNLITARTLYNAGYSKTTGTVTNIGMTVPTGLSVSPSSIATSGTFAISLANGYSIPTTTEKTTWSNKQNALTAGTNISISGSTINATIPTATSSVLGGVIAGTNISIASNGTISIPTMIYVSTTEPTTTTFAIWINSSTNCLKYWSGSAWTDLNCVYA